MGGITKSIFSIILGLEIVIGILGNGFIALVNGVDWARRRKLSPVDRILTALAVSRFCHLWLALLNWCISAFYQALLINGLMVRLIYFPLTVSNHLSIWLATGLIIFYFLKIANFSNSIFFYLKWRVKKVVSATLVMSLILLLLNIVLLHTDIDVLINEAEGNMSDSSSSWKVAAYSRLSLFNSTVFTFVPFAVSLTTLVLLIFSLWRHLKTMQGSAPGCRDASTAAHVKALQTVVTFLLLYAIHFLSLFLKTWRYAWPEKKSISLLAQTTDKTFASIHSCVLILGDSKLRQASVSLLWWFRGRSRDVGPSGP